MKLIIDCYHEIKGGKQLKHQLIYGGSKKERVAYVTQYLQKIKGEVFLFDTSNAYGELEEMMSIEHTLGTRPTATPEEVWFDAMAQIYADFDSTHEAFATLERLYQYTKQHTRIPNRLNLEYATKKESECLTKIVATKLFYTRVFQPELTKTPLCIVFDRAELLVSPQKNKQEASIIEMIVREGRNYNIHCLFVASEKEAVSDTIQLNVKQVSCHKEPLIET